MSGKMKVILSIVGLILVFFIIGKLNEGRQQKIIVNGKEVDVPARSVAPTPEKPKKQISEKESESMARVIIAGKLSATFKDAGIEARIKAKGTDYTTLRIDSDACSDLMIAKFRKDGLHDQWRNMGFKMVEYTNGVNYNRSIEL